MTVKANLLIGDVRERLRGIPAGTVQTCITSPPYWGLRDYGVAGQIGSEKTPEEFIATMVDVFRLVRETLRKDGTLWLNLGDSYDNGTSSKRKDGGLGVARWQKESVIGTKGRINGGLGAGNQLLMPHRVAMALQADGWILRSTVIWSKRSPMPESLSGWRWVPCKVKVTAGQSPARNRKPEVKRETQHLAGPSIFPANAVWEPCPGCDKCRENGGLILRQGKWRPTTAHEYVFLFSKSADYYADGEAVAELAEAFLARGRGVTKGGYKGKQANAGVERSNSSFKAKIGNVVETRNPRSVWTLSHEPYKGAHFATFPSELVRRMLLATTPAECCGKCGAGYAPVVTKERVPTRPGTSVIPIGDSGANRDPQRHIQRTVVTGYQPTCRCNAPPARAIVLDPFAGSGTTLQVARHYGRDSIGIELSETYAAMARERIEQTPRCAVSKQQRRAKTTKPNAQRKLFD